MLHTYRVALKHVSNHHGDPVEGGVYEFDATNHDNLLEIIERAKQNPILREDDAAAFAVGLKLVAEVVMKRHNDAPFSEFWPHLGEFIRRIKASAKHQQASK